MTIAEKIYWSKSSSNYKGIFSVVTLCFKYIFRNITLWYTKLNVTLHCQEQGKLILLKSTHIDD